MQSTKKLDVPDIGDLLGQITERRNDLPKSPIQSVQPVAEKTEIQEKPEKRKAVSTQKSTAAVTAKRLNGKTGKALDGGERGIGGRPTLKRDDVDYVKLSPRIPKELKKQVELALIHERYRDKDGNVIKTMDEFVALALNRLLLNT